MSCKGNEIRCSFGQLGGGVPNVIHYVSDCIASMKDPITNRILIPGFYDNVHDFGNFNSNSLLAKII